jgi:NTP pyrophosphatase (non-canonical NTP hydrolase)
MNYTKMQIEHAEWLVHEYPEQPPWMPAVGCVEEAGELLHAVLKREQMLMYGEHPRFDGTDWQAEMVDAIGDCAVYACSLCNACGWSFQDLMETEEQECEDATEAAYELIHAAVQVAEHLRVHYLEAYISFLKGAATSLNIRFDWAVSQTWEVVRRRHR